MADNQERHYNVKILNIIFAIASLALLGALVFMFFSDYSRQWKDYQKKFRALEVEKTRTKYAAEEKNLSEQETYKDLQKQIAEAQKAYSAKAAEIKALESEIAKYRAHYDIVNQQLQFAKAQSDAVKYSYEEAINHKHGDATALKKDLDGLEAKSVTLRLDLEKTNAEIAARNKKIQEFGSHLKEIEKDQKAASKQADILAKKLKKIDPKVMTTANKIADAVRDLPIVDMTNPNYKVQQIVLKDIKDSVNFMEVPKVDRCITCHLGINNPDFKDAPQPFTTHPNLELFVAPNSKHPMEEFGCTTCHGGRGRGTDFITAAHTPSTPQQQAEWEKKHDWHPIYWEAPMYPKQYVEAGCFKCHSGETVIKGAEKLNLGLNLIEKAGCYGCHVIDKYKDWPKAGPDLTHLAAKTTEQWVYRWIQDPVSFRHNTWMPSFFGQSNNSDPESLKRSEQEIYAIVHYLFESSKEFKLDDPSVGDAKNGEEIVKSVGCFACHSIEPKPTDTKTTRETLRREHGPNLIGLGTKTTKAWLYNWLKDPTRYHPGTKMPNLRLSDQEAADVAAFLSADKKADYLKTPLPLIDEPLLNDITKGFLIKSTSVADADAQLAAMKSPDKLLYSGKKLIRQYGCFACHDIAGFENEKPIGTELTEEGSKSAHKLDFGFIHMEHTNNVWFAQKLKDPRIFDQGKVKTPDEKLRMPNYNFTDDEIEAIVTAILGFTKEKPEASKMKPRTPENLFIEEGAKIVRQLNCQGCHLIEGEGAAIQPKITEWLMSTQGKSEAEAKATTPSFSPPNLIGEGKKVQAEWLFQFLHSPTTIRPWLKTRMPTYHFNTAHLNAVVKYFNYLDHQEFPFVQSADTKMTDDYYKAAELLFSKDYFGCASCHIVGDKMPEGSPDSWAPNFALAKSRLKPDWIIEWLKNPQDLLPGTKMPTYFDPQYFESSGPDDLLGGDEHAQIKALRDYILSLSETKAELNAAAPAPAKPVAPAPTAPQSQAVSPVGTVADTTTAPPAK